MAWTPITIEELHKLILPAEKELSGELLSFWESIRITPEKWQEEKYGTEGGGFWVVALIGRKVIYYNDIEEGFNVSDYKTYGSIETYACSQDELIQTIHQLFERTNPGGI